jgi:DNA mismatch endonuclease, patch repair protein
MADPQDNRSDYCGRVSPMTAASSPANLPRRRAARILDRRPRRVGPIGRSENMRRIASRDTSPELALRHYLYALGFRYRTCVRGLPGKPDVVNKRCKLAVFVHGCFWHQHPGCIDASEPKTNRSYWLPKLKRNVERDAEHVAALRGMDYRVVVVWDCEIARDAPRVASRIARLAGQMH